MIQGPQHLHGEAWRGVLGGEGGTLASERGREDTSCKEQMSLGPEQQAGGCRRERDVVRDPPLHSRLENQEKRDELLFFSPLLTL